MSNAQNVIDSIYTAIDEFNMVAEEPRRLEKSPDTILFGEEGRLDSLGLVSLIMEIEGQIQADFETTITLADERAMSRLNSPFRSVDSLAGYIVEILDEKDLV